MKYYKLSFFIFTSYERSECFIFGVKRKMLHNEVASSEKDSFLWSTPVGVWSILRHCRKIWSPADAVWSKSFSGFMFFCLEIKAKKWRRAFFSPPAIVNGFLSLKTQNFAVKSNSENHFKYEREYSDECYSRKYVVNSPGNSTSCFISPIRLIGFSLGIINPPSCFLCGRYLW